VSYLISKPTHCADVEFPVRNDSDSDVVDDGEVQRGIGSKREGYYRFCWMLTEHLHGCSIVACVRDY
jgi:hypothetical protein